MESPQPVPRNIPSDWLDQPGSPDPWRIDAASPGVPGHRDAAIGNGLWGLRVGPDGDGHGALMHGFWGQSPERRDRPEALARLPRFVGLRVDALTHGLSRPDTEILAHTQSLDLRTGTVTTVRQIRSPEGTVDIVHRIWVARADKHLAVEEVDLRVLEGRGAIHVSEDLDALDLPDLADPFAADDDGDLLLAATAATLGHRIAVGSRLLIETENPRQVFHRRSAATGASARRSLRIALPPGGKARIVKVMAAAEARHASDPIGLVRTELRRAESDLSGLRARHEAAWASLWESRIETDHPRLQLLLNAFVHQLYATLRDDEPFSHGPCGLSHTGWDGTIFWDTDLWTLPVIALLSPALGMACARYRVNTLPGARANAAERGEAGARYAWQSADTGRECCVRPVFQDQRHINSDVARGQWIAALAAGDRAHLLGPGLDVIRACAEHWVSLIQTDPDGTAHIRHITGPDEDAGYVDDNATTNWGAAWTLRKAHALSLESGLEPDPRWLDLAGRLHIPQHPLGFPQQMAGWREDQIIKQADAVLLAHPWDYPMDDATRAAMVDYYRHRYPPTPIMMGSAIDGIVDCQLGRAEAAWDCLRGMLPHLRPPYFHVTEQPTNENGNFLTGIGGLLQLVCMGFAGLRLHEDGELGCEPCLPPALNWLTLRGIHHRGDARTLEVIRRQDGSVGAVWG